MEVDVDVKSNFLKENNKIPNQNNKVLSEMNTGLVRRDVRYSLTSGMNGLFPLFVNFTGM